jgi:anti-sigma factor RsiW
MNCHEARTFMDAWLDDELDVADTLSLEQHVAGCAECRRARQQAEALRTALRKPELRYQPPPGMTGRLQQALRSAPAPETQVREMPAPQRRWSLPAWAQIAAMVAIVAAGAVYVTHQTGVSRQANLVGQVLASHIRSLQPGHLTDVLSTDKHTVKPWFQGKLDFSPPVPEPPTPDWTLVGGRLDYLDNRPVAALVYAWRKHTVNVFVWPSASAEPAEHETVQGYHILHQAREGMTWWIVSDLNEGDLQEFGNALK